MTLVNTLLKVFGISLWSNHPQCFVCGETKMITYKGYFTMKSMARKPLFLCKLHNVSLTQSQGGKEE